MDLADIYHLAKNSGYIYNIGNDKQCFETRMYFYLQNLRGEKMKKFMGKRLI